jgi:hypothetical protein
LRAASAAPSPKTRPSSGADGGLKRAEAQGGALGAARHDLTPELLDHLVVVELQDLVHRQIALDDLFEQHARRRHAYGAALALVGDVGYVLVVLRTFEVDSDYVAAARVAPGHRHIGVL